MSGLRVGSLFSGIGGFDLAAERVGMIVAWQSEIEPFACRVLAHRFPRVPNLGDVTKIEDAPPVDIITFGFPCQDVSVAGKRAGMQGARSGLFFEAIRVIERVRPAIAVAENVPGLLSSNRGRDLAAVLGALADIGALDIGWRVLDAQHFGVPQRRRRVFLVADFAGRRAAEILALAEGGGGHPAPRQATGQDVAYTLAASVRGTGDGHGNAWNTTYAIQNGARPREYSQGLGISEDVMYTLDTFGEHAVAPCDTRRYGKGTDSDASDALIVADLAQITSKANRSRVEAGLRSSTLAAESQMVAFTNRGVALDGAHETLRAASHGALPMVAVPLTAGGHPNSNMPGRHREDDENLTPITGGVRRLTPVECERLQGFPDSWTCLYDHPQPCDCPDGARYRCLGNAVATPVAEWLLGRIAAVVS